MTNKTKPMSLSAYARHRKCSYEAVRKAIQSGRLDQSIVMVAGKPKIADPELADREWRERTRTATAPAKKADGGAKVGTPKKPVADDNIDYAEARRRREVERWRCTQIKRQMDQLDLAQREGELIRVDEARATVLERFTVVRTKLLGVPQRARQRLPHLSADDVRMLDGLVREALEELVDVE